MFAATKHQPQWTKWLALTFLVFTVLAGCQPAPATPHKVPQQRPGRTVQPPTTTPSPTFTSLPTSTPTPSPTPTPTVAFPVSAGTPYPLPSTAINAKTAAQITLLAKFGHGMATSILYAPAQNQIVVGSTAGITWYDADHLTAIDFWPTTKPVGKLALSPDGQHLAAGAGDQVLLWDIAQRKIIRILDMVEGEEDNTPSQQDNTNNAPPYLRPVERWISALQFSPDGQWLAAGAKHRLAVWEVATGERHSAEGLNVLRPTWVNTVQFSQDSRYLMVGSAQEVVLFQVNPWKRRIPPSLMLSKSGSTSPYYFEGPITNYDVGGGEVVQIARSADGRFFAAGYSSGAVVVWDTAHPFQGDKNILSPWRFWWPHKSNILYLEFLDDHTLAFISGQHLEIRDVTAEDQEGKIRNETLGFYPMVISPINANEWAAVDAIGQVVRVRINAEDITSTPDFSVWIEDAARMPNGREVVLAGWLSDLKIQDITNGRLVRTLRIKRAVLPFVAVDVAPDGSWLAAVDWAGTVWHYDLRTDITKVIHTLPLQNDVAWTISISPSGDLLSVGTWHGAVYIVDVPKNTILRSLQTQPGTIIHLDFSPDGKYLAGTSVNQIILWNAQIGNVVQIWTKNTKPTMGWVYAAAWHPSNANILLSGSNDKRWRVWETGASEPLIVSEPLEGKISHVAWNVSGELIAVSAYSTISLWNPESGARLAQTNWHADEIADFYAENGSAAPLPQPQEMTEKELQYLYGKIPLLDFALNDTALVEVTSDGIIRVWGITP